MSNESYLKRMINTRFIIPLKILIGAFVATSIYTILHRGEDLTTLYTYIAETVMYSIFACLMFTIGDYVVHIGTRIYRKLTNKEVKEE